MAILVAIVLTCSIRRVFRVAAKSLAGWRVRGKMKPKCFSATATLAFPLRIAGLNGVLFERQANNFRSITVNSRLANNFEDFQRFREAMQLSLFDNEAAVWR